MKKNRKLTPRNAAPVKRQNVATVSRDGSAIAPLTNPGEMHDYWEDAPFAGDDAE